jgi:hypothetical protein
MHASDERQQAVDLFNHVWTLMETADRTPEQDDEMIHAAHASRHHWAAVGTGKNLARGEWQISRMYTTLGRGEPALYHAHRCLAYCEVSPDEIEDWDIPFAHEALSRAHLTAGNLDEAKRHAARARELAAQVADKGEREQLEKDLSTLP